MTDTLISFETAILAKEKGFNKKVLFSYENSYKKSFLYCGGVLYNSSKNKYSYTENLEYNLYNHNSQKKLKVYSAPSQSLLQKWLREKHNIIILIELKDSSMSLYTPITIYVVSKTTMMIAHLPKSFDSYEDALEAGLIEGLKLIK